MSTPKATTEAVTLSLGSSLAAQVRARAASEHISEQEVLEAAVSSYFDAKDRIHEAIQLGQEKASRGELLDFDEVEADLRRGTAERRRSRAR